jgi:hypothetical protein
MGEGYVKIHKYIRSDLTFAGYDGKVFAYMMGCFLFALYLTNSWQLFMIIGGFGIWSGNKLQEKKDSALRGAINHWLYYFGYFDARKPFVTIPPSHIKEFIA